MVESPYQSRGPGRALDPSRWKPFLEPVKTPIMTAICPTLTSFPCFCHVVGVRKTIDWISLGH